MHFLRWTQSCAHRAVRGCCVLAASGAAWLPVPAWAQAADQASEGIVVTGTRIHTGQPAELEPGIKIDAAWLEARGLTNLADGLNEAPGIRGSVTPAGSQGTFGQGVNFINTFGLGSNRTLTLVNGRRVVSSNVPTTLTNATPGTQVDLNTIPAILVDRIERIAIGGAPVYGSDAIAGTVNIVLRRSMQGIDLRASHGFTGEGDNARWAIAAAGGTGFAGGRGHVTAAVSFEKVAGVFASERGFYRDSPTFLPNPCTVLQTGICTATNLVANLGPAARTPANDGRVNSAIGFNNSASDGYPGAVLVRDVRLPGITTGGVLSSGGGAYGWQFAPDGALVPYDKGVPFGAPIPGVLAAAATASGGQGLALNDYNQIASSTRRINAALMFSYELDDAATLFAEGLFYSGRADELVQQPAFNATLFTGVSGALSFRTDNPFLTAQARQQLAALGYGSTFQLSRADGELADLTGYSTSQLWRGVVGIDGAVHIGSRAFSYEATVTYGRSDFTDHGQTIDQQRFVNAVNVASVGGQIVCSGAPTVTGFPTGTAPVADPACKPLNLFGTGAPSKEAIDYVRRGTVSHSRLEQLVVNLNLGGSPFDLFGNPVSVNTGFEYHREAARFSPDPFLEAGLGRSSAVVPVSGNYDLKELFGEVLVPLVAPDNRFPLARRIELFGRIRQVFAGQGKRYTSWAAGGIVEPIEGVILRGNYTRSFRTPSILELYAPRSTIKAAVSDLCSTTNISGGSVPDIRRANCTVFLARYPLATPLAAASAGVATLTGGNPALRAETARSHTFGLVLRPAFMPRLNLAIDYLDIAIADPIASLSVGQIAQGCFDNPDFDASDPAHANAFCSLIARDANGQVVNDTLNPGVVSGFVNGKVIRMSGVQASLAWSASLEGLRLAGQIDIGADVFHLRHRLSDITGVAPLRSDGLIGDPTWQGQLRLRYTNRRWAAGVQVNYTGALLLAVTNRGAAPNDTREFDHFRPFATVDSHVSVETVEGLRLSLVVTNLFNRVGQEYFGMIVPGSINDALGRRMTFSLRKQW